MSRKHFIKILTLFIFITASLSAYSPPSTGSSSPKLVSTEPSNKGSTLKTDTSSNIKREDSTTTVSSVTPEPQPATANTENKNLTSSVTSTAPKPKAAAAKPVTAAAQPKSTSNATAAKPSPSSAPVAANTAAAFTHKKLLAYSVYYYNGDHSSYDSLTSNYKSIGELATQTFVVDGAGNLSGLIPSAQLSYAKSKGIRTYTMITNNFDPSIAKVLLENSSNRANLIGNILMELKSNGYGGINVDLEGIYSYDRPYLTAFMKELYTSLKPSGYALTMSAPAETYDNPNNGWNGAFNYADLAKYTDEIILMTYDESFEAPGPIASIDWVKKVVSYAVSVIPASKIKLGTAAYGYDWSTKGRKALSIEDAYNLASNFGTAVIWDTASASPHFDYVDGDGISHSVWFEDSRSLSYKLDLVNSSGLSGIAIWRIGLEDADYWKAINSKLY